MFIDISMLWRILNSNIVSGLILLFLSIFISVWIIDLFRSRAKRRTLLSIIARDLNNIPKFKEVDSRYFRMPISDYFYREALSSDYFSYNKDKVLLIRLHELCSLIEMFNSMAEGGNLSIITGKTSNSGTFARGTNELLKDIIEKKEIIETLVTDKYKVYPLELP